MLRKVRAPVLVLGLTSGLILTTIIAGYYFWLYEQTTNAYQDLLHILRGVKYSASVLFDFGNGTRVWFNNTRVPLGWNLYNLTVNLMQGRVTAIYYPQYRAHFVTGIDGVNNTQNKFWFVWLHDNSSSWYTSPVGADDVTIHNESLYAWTFCATGVFDQPQCHP